MVRHYFILTYYLFVFQQPKKLKRKQLSVLIVLLYLVIFHYNCIPMYYTVRIETVQCLQFSYA